MAKKKCVCRQERVKSKGVTVKVMARNEQDKIIEFAFSLGRVGAGLPILLAQQPSATSGVSHH